MSASRVHSPALPTGLGEKLPFSQCPRRIQRPENERPKACWTFSNDARRAGVLMAGNNSDYPRRLSWVAQLQDYQD